MYNNEDEIEKESIIEETTQFKPKKGQKFGNGKETGTVGKEGKHQKRKIHQLKNQLNI